MKSNLVLLASLFVVAACGSKKPDSEPVSDSETTTDTKASETPASDQEAATDKPSKPVAETCAKLPTWRFERIELPPEFAPTLPAGVEKLYFAPGMFKPGDPGYWSYVFSLEFTDAGPTDGDAVTKLLVDYYAGLIGAVAKGKKLTLEAPFAKVKVTTKSGGGFAAEVSTYDAFTTGKPIVVHLDVQPTNSGSCLNVAASPADKSAPIWTELETARSCVPCSAL